MHIRQFVGHQVEELHSSSSTMHSNNQTSSQTDRLMSSTMENNSSTSDPFDVDAAPTMYMSDNRTPAITDISLVVISIMFLTSLLLILILLPGIRRNKWRNFACLSLMIIAGASILLSIMKNTWMLGEIELNHVPYDSLQRNQFSGIIRVEIGLKSMNASLIGRVFRSEYLSNDQEDTNQEQAKLVNYNERFYFDEPDKMQLEHQEALRRGLPYPILAVSEFFSQDSDGFNWTRQIRQAGYYTSLMLYVTTACWLVTALIMCVLPAYFLTMLRTTCLLSAASHLNYLICASILLPSTIVIYSNKLVINTNYMITVGAICSLMAYYCAQYIDVVFELQDIDQSLTIMDSEDYLKDKRALSNGSKSSSFLSLSTDLHRNSVIIPIGDIEEKFKLGQKPK